MKQGVKKWQSTNRYLYSRSGNFQTLDFIPAIFLADKLNQLINEEENSFKPCLTKQPLNKFKLWCEWGIRFRTINTNNDNLVAIASSLRDLPILNKVDDHDNTQVRIVSNKKDLFKVVPNLNWRLLRENETDITGLESRRPTQDQNW